MARIFKIIASLAFAGTLFCASCFCAGCQSLGYYKKHFGTYSAISTRELDLKNVAVSKLPRKEDCVGHASVPVIFCLIPLGFYPSADDAVENALEVNGGDLMLDAKISQTDWSCFFWGASGFEVTGTVVNTKSAGTQNNSGSAVPLTRDETAAGTPNSQEK